MRISINRTESDLFVQGEWISGAGVFSRRLTADMPTNILLALETFLDWADDLEKQLVIDNDVEEETRNIREQISKHRLRLLELGQRE